MATMTIHAQPASSPSAAPAAAAPAAAPAEDPVLRDAELVYNYHRLHMPLAPADAIFCLCSLDTRVAVRAAELFLDGLAPRLIFSGGVGKLTRGRFAESEAEAFARIARCMGVPDHNILVEPKSTNTGENVRLTHALLEGKGLRPRTFILVQKPYMERRTFATFAKQWPDAQAQFVVTSPQLALRDYFDDDNPRDLVINVMVGDLVRIREYPARGFQIPQDIPAEVWHAKDRLVAAGFDKHLP